MSRFFIDRPIFAWVVAIVVMLAGVLAIRGLPISQFPTIAPVSVSISATYPGASAKTLEDTVTQVIEQKMQGIDKMLYMSSTSDASGAVSVSLTFDSGADPDIAQVQVQNKLQLAMPLLPQEVQRQGIRVTKSSADFLMVLGFVSTDGSMDATDVADYVAANVQDPISRVNGVGDVSLFGSQYAMRIWLDPARLASFRLTPSDVVAAVQATNAQVSAGQLGATPAVQGQQINATVTAQSRLQSPEEFREILLRVERDGSMVRLRDVATVELGSDSYNTVARFNGKPAAGLAIKSAVGANALDAAAGVRARVAELQRFFPAGLETVYPNDSTPFVRISIEGVVHTLAEAIVLVFLVMYLFLQNLRATLIPTIAVPVVLLGTFGILSVLGFSINTLTMFAMVLAIGLLVDDAIVVVENVERVMAEEGLSPREATRKSMGQITGALVGIALVLSAVFVPMAFFGGSTGVIYRQFSVTIVSSMALSVLVAIVLTPALCATLLRPGHGDPLKGQGPFARFNRAFDRTTRRYERAVGGILRRRVRTGLVYLAVVGALAFLFVRLPTAFLPDEDQGSLYAMMQLPVGATQGRTLDVLGQVESHFLKDEAVEAVFGIAGFGFAGSGQNVGMAFVKLKDWSERPRPDQHVKAVAGRAMGAFSRIRDGLVFAFAPPAVRGMGNSNGFDLQLQDRGGLGHEALLKARDRLLALAAKSPVLSNVRANGQDDTPQFKLDVDPARAGALGLSFADANAVISTAWGGTYVNDFIDRGRVKRVYVQGEASGRMLPDDLGKWFARNADGEMVGFNAFTKAAWSYGPPRLERFNGLPSVEILGAAAPGKASGDAMSEMEALVGQLQPGIGFEWTGLSYQERLSSDRAPALYAISLLVVFLCLAALYESWSVPFSVMLVVPLGVLGAVAAAAMTGLSNDVYFQVGLLTTIGLSAKNAILIVEFAKDLQERGKGLVEATLEACRMRLRPILMTSLAFALGVVPLAVKTGAGAASQNAIGIGVLGGMVAATVLGVFFVPLFFVTVRRLSGARARPAAATVAEAH